MYKWTTDTAALLHLIEPEESGTWKIVEIHAATTIAAARVVDDQSSVSEESFSS